MLDVNVSPLVLLPGCSNTQETGTCKLQVQREGTDVTLVGYGKMVGYNLEAAEQLEKEGISCEVSITSAVLAARAAWCTILQVSDAMYNT